MSQTVMEQADSIHAQEDTKKDEQKQKSRRPPNTAFRQQRLKAWQPILTPKTVLPLFFAVGIIFAPIGGLLLYASAKVQELEIQYQNCAGPSGQAPQSPTFSPIPSQYWSSYFKHSTPAGQEPMWSQSTNYTIYGNATGSGVFNNESTPVCTLQFYLPDDLAPPVLLYYVLTNFYQNHRRYVKSFDQDQLKGTYRSPSAINSSDCDPLKTESGSGKPYYPCGLIANSLFNDTFYSPIALNAPGAETTNTTYGMTEKGTAWSSDAALYGASPYSNDEVVPPPNWAKRYPNGYSDDYPQPSLSDMENFQVWMRTAGLPTFSKLALRNDSGTMTSGTYQIAIDSLFPVTDYDGTKAILISTSTVMGGKNPFLGIAYVVVAGICVLLGALFTVTHLIKPRKLGDHSYLSWNNDSPANAITTGRASRPGDSGA